MSERIYSILDMPDDILVEIFLHLNARERLELAEACTRFNGLVFGHQELLRGLDFSKNGRLTSATHIREYFSNEMTWEYLRKVNLQNVKCITAGYMLNDSIGRATNLVDLNILGVKFLHIKQLGIFLEPLIHVKRLSIKWPRMSSDESLNCSKILEKPFGRITYLLMEVPVAVRNFLNVLELCQELVELHVATPGDSGFLPDNFSNIREPGKLRKLKIIQLYMHSSVRKELLQAIVPDPQEWTDFQLCDSRGVPYHYYEKNLQICEKIRASKLIENMTCLSRDYSIHQSTFGWRLIPETLLNEVIRITHKDTPEIFCSLIADTTNTDIRPFLLKIDEAKRLLKDPGYQISYLNLTHEIMSDCDAHLVASAFPNLTELRLNSIRVSQNEEATIRQKKHYRRRLRRRDNAACEERDDPENVDSSFKMLIENTPHVKSLTIHPVSERDYEWDFEALGLIPLWNNLRSLYLVKIPVRDGKFLINIGRECKQLEKLVLQELWDVAGDGALRNNSYTDDLPEMLSHCKSLKKFSIHHNKLIKNVAQMFVSLSNNLNIRRVRVTKLFCSHSYNFSKIIPSIEKLLHRCKKLITFVFITDNQRPSPDELMIALERIKGQLNRPELQFGTAKHPDPDLEELNSTFSGHDDASISIY